MSENKSRKGFYCFSSGSCADAVAGAFVSSAAIAFSSAGAGAAGSVGPERIIALPLRDAREVFEREYLAAQILRFGGNISRTAAFIGMERSALHRKLKSLGVAPLRGGEEDDEA